MSIFIGQNELKEIYIGNKQILQVYKGSELVWELESGGGDEPIPTPTFYTVSIKLNGSIYDETYQITYRNKNNELVTETGLSSDKTISVYENTSITIDAYNDSIYAYTSDYDTYSNITEDTEIALNYTQVEQESVTTTVSCTWEQLVEDSQFTGEVKVTIKYYNPTIGDQSVTQSFDRFTSNETMEIDLHKYDTIDTIICEAVQNVGDRGDHNINRAINGIESNVVTGDVTINITVKD